MMLPSETVDSFIYIKSELKRICVSDTSTLRAILQVWKGRKGKLLPGISLMIPLYCHPTFHNKDCPMDIMAFKQKGLYRLKEFYLNAQPLPRELWRTHLKETGITWLAWYQVGTFIRREDIKEQALRNSTPFESLFIYLLHFYTAQ